MLENKKDKKEHKYGAANRRMREADFDHVSTIFKEFGLEDREEYCKYLRKIGHSNHGRCNIKHDRNRVIPGYRKYKQMKKEKDTNKMERNLEKQEATFA